MISVPEAAGVRHKVVAGWRARRGSGAPLGVMLAIQTYLALTFACYLWGPLEFPDLVNQELPLMVIAYQLCFGVGYVLGPRPERPPGPAVTMVLGWNWLSRLVAMGCSVSVGMSAAVLAHAAGSWNPAVVVRHLILAVTDSAAAYYSTVQSGASGSLLTTAMTALVPFTFAASVVGLVSWKRIPAWVRVLVVADLVLQVVVALVRGQNLGYFRVAMILGAVIVVNMTNRKRTRKERVRLVGSLAFVGVITVAYFAKNTSSRFFQSRPALVNGTPVNYESGLMTALPDFLQLPVVVVSSYLGQGYHGLRQALAMEFRSSWGVGNSAFLTQNVNSVLGVDVTERTYVQRMDPVWDSSTHWHTAYTWYANDVGPWGVMVVMAIVGWFVARVLMSASRLEIPGLVLLPLVLLGVVFIPANNIVLSNPLTGMAALVWGGIFLVGQLLPSAVWARPRLERAVSFESTWRGQS